MLDVTYTSSPGMTFLARAEPVACVEANGKPLLGTPFLFLILRRRLCISPEQTLYSEYVLPLRSVYGM